MRRLILFCLPFLWLPQAILAVPGAEEMDDVKLPVLAQRVEPRFPRELSELGITHGKATVLCEIGVDGTLIDWIPLWATHPAFIVELDKVIDQWRFKPAEKNGEAKPANLRLDVRFESGKIVLGINAIEYARILAAHIEDTGSGVSYVFAGSELDRTPQPVHTVAPRIYADVPPEERGGEAMVTFFIDSEGHVRIPVLSELKGHPLLGISAYEAIEQWRFEPPTRNGRRVYTKAVQRFQFSPQE